MSTRVEVVVCSGRVTVPGAPFHRFIAAIGGSRLARSGAVISLAALSGCSAATEGQVGQLSEASVRTPQTPLDGNTVPKFVDQLPTFNGRRQSGSVTLNVSMQEFQQKVLP